VVERLKRLLAGAQARQQPFPHLLLLGPSGVGKTLLARTLAAEYGTRLLAAMGHDTRPRLAEHLAALLLCDFLFIDEAHRLGPLEQDLLCEAIDENSIPNTSRRENDRGEAAARVGLPPWTLIVASDQPGHLAAALLKRLHLQVDLDTYPPDEMKEVVEELAGHESLLLTPQAARLLAEASAGVPRRARGLLHTLRYHFADSEGRQIGQAEVREFLQSQGIDRRGLGSMEQRYLRRLATVGSASLQSLALSLHTDTVFLRREVEAPLVKRGLIEIGPSGRRLTVEGREWARGGGGQTSGAREEVSRCSASKLAGH
jgi:Holliday junction DNA helicase RuvB